MKLTNQKLPPREPWFVTGVFVLYLVVALGFSLGPIFEGWDEPGHYRVTYEMIRQRAVPDPFTKPAGEFQQAPLYYALMIPPTLLVGAPDIHADEMRFNPEFGYAWSVVSQDNKNLFIHRADERFPYNNHPVDRAIHLLRLTSVILNGATLWLCYLIFMQLWPDRPDRRVAALGVAAFWPVFDSLSGLINNDNLAIFLAVLALYLLIKKPQQGFDWRWAAGLGLVLGAGLITKTNLAFLALPTAVVLLTDRRSWKAIPLIAVIVAGVAGWYYVHNYIRFGDFAGLTVFEKLFPEWVIPRDQIDLIVVLQRLAYMYRTIWVRFGFNIIGVDWPIESLFAMLTMITLLTLPLLIAQLWQKWRSGAVDLIQMESSLIVAIYGLGILLISIYGAAQPVTLAQGRYILPALPALAAAIALSIETWLPSRIRQTVLLSLPPLLAAIALICLFGYYLPVFRLDAVPKQIAHPLNIPYGEIADLVGTQQETITVRPGEVARLTLIWRAHKPADTNLMIEIKAGPVSRTSLPGAGKLYATEWQVGQSWSETYVLPIPADAKPGTYPIEVSLLTPDGTSLGESTPIVAQLIISP